LPFMPFPLEWEGATKKLKKANARIVIMLEVFMVDCRFWYGMDAGRLLKSEQKAKNESISHSEDDDPSN
jgi:hypothetical protein